MFITFEGIEGSGKSTILERTAAVLRTEGLRVIITREPGGTAFGRELRALLLDARRADFSPRAELLLFLADRAQHLHEVILPALAEGGVLLCDRYADSTFAYQGNGRGLDTAMLERLNFYATDGLNPDLTLLFDLPVEMGMARAAERNREEGTALSEGRFDAEHRNFHTRVREGYLRLARDNPQRWAVIDAAPPTDAVLRSALAVVRGRLALAGPPVSTVNE